ncbi:MAG: hypothetical protein WAN92_08290 [Herbaspirillum sp.]
MTMRVKIFLFWLLAMALPVQGFAAAAQVPCAPSAPMHAIAAQAAPASERHDAGQVIGQHQHKASSPACNACGACSIGAILPLTLDKLIRLPLAADIHVATVQHEFTSHTPENPERPPPLLVSLREIPASSFYW